MQAFKKVNAVVVGCGMISDVYMRNLTGENRIFDSINLIACSDLRPEAARDRAQKYGLKVMTLDEICNDPEIEMVINLTAPTAHYRVIKQALESGKHVYSEKILTIRMEEALELASLADKKGVYLGASPDTFLGASCQNARQLVESGLIGQPSSAIAMVNRDYQLMPELIPYVSREGGGIGFDVGIYYITALLSILGGVSEVTGFMRTNNPDRTHIMVGHDDFGMPYHVESENLMVGSMLFENGMVGSLHFNSECIMNERPHLAIYGTEGIVYLGNPDQFGDAVRLVRKGQTEPVIIPANHGYASNSRGLGAAEMAWSIRKGRPNRASKELACHALEVLHGVAISAREKKTYILKTSYKKTPPLPQGFLGEDYYGSNPEVSLAL